MYAAIRRDASRKMGAALLAIPRRGRSRNQNSVNLLTMDFVPRLREAWMQNLDIRVNPCHPWLKIFAEISDLRGLQ